MRAVVVRAFGGPEVLRLGEAADPMPAEGEVVVRVRAAGVNPVDTYIRTGTYARKPPLPYIPGTDGAGEVASVGAGVRRVRPGDRVYIGGGVIGIAAPGTYAELVAVPEANVWPLPERLTFEQGAAVGIPYGTAYRALFQKALAQPDEWLLVHGASGGVGIACVQFARAHGMRVIGTAGSDEGRALVAQAGAHVVLDHRQAGYLDEIADLTDGHGVDVVVEMLANVNLARDLDVAARYGRIVCIGSRGTVEINPVSIRARECRIDGFILFDTPGGDLTRAYAAITAGLENGTLTPVVGRRFPLADAPEAHRAVIEERALGKTVLIP